MKINYEKLQKIANMSEEELEKLIVKLGSSVETNAISEDIKKQEKSSRVNENFEKMR